MRKTTTIAQSSPAIKREARQVEEQTGGNTEKVPEKFKNG